MAFDSCIGVYHSHHLFIQGEGHTAGAQRFGEIIEVEETKRRELGQFSRHDKQLPLLKEVFDFLEKQAIVLPSV